MNAVIHTQLCDASALALDGFSALFRADNAGQAGDAREALNDAAACFIDALASVATAAERLGARDMTSTYALALAGTGVTA